MNYQFDFSSVLTGVYGSYFLTGVRTTFLLFVICWFLAFALGIVLVTLGRIKFWPLNFLVRFYVEYHRNVPLLVQLLFWYFAIPQIFPSVITDWINLRNSEFVYAMIALSLYSSSYISENIRSGLRAIPPVQFEAAEAMGFSQFGTMIWIIIPQAWRHALPALIGDSIGLFKGTAIASVIGVAELTYQTEQIESATFRVFEVFTLASLVYLSVTIPMMILGDYAGRRFAIRSSR
ncbi:amino acid ABC transporter permease [Tropicimonas sp. IMCC34043]|uniref:amino acid ABC transporter permease n=1 Tax=Tropicimonas sp. IMCC34043 TaxID=2248760 RepID=UPI000E26EE13|nr:amino acid ABC transporter permease [Tropicimonas sp. IMCC34043]